MSDGFVVTHCPSQYIDGVGVVDETPRFIANVDTYAEAQEEVSKDQSRRIEEMNMTDQEAEEFDYADWIMVDKSDYGIVPYKIASR